MRPEPLNRRQPPMSTVDQRIQVSLVVAVTNLSDGNRITGPHLWIARPSTSRDRSLQPCPRPLADQCALEFGKGTEQLRHQHPLGTGGVDWIVDRPEIGALGAQGLDDFEQVGQRARQTVDAHDQQGIPLPHPFQRPREVGPVATAAARLVLE